MADFEQELARLLRDFTTRISATVRQHALTSASAALLAARPVARGRRPSAASEAAAEPERRSAERKAAKEPFDAAAAGPQLVSFLLANPGLRVDELGFRLQLPTSDLKPLVKKLVANRMLRAEGNTRGRRYFPTRRATSATEQPASPGRRAKAARPRTAKKRPS
jgi:hypothetical protein